MNPKSISKAIRIFSLSIGATALCMLSALGILSPSGFTAAAAEASVFNNGKTFQNQEISIPASVSPPKNVVPLGSAFGIKLFTDGVIVASLSDIYTTGGVCCPAAEAGLKPGDYLLRADGMEIQSNAALAAYIGKSQGKSVLFQVKRGDSVFEASVTPVFGEGSFKTGMWVRDSAAGIGTLTFFDPATGIFAGLGHGICDMDTSSVMPLKSGQPAPITLCGVTRGKENEPGQLKGYFSSEKALGTLLENNETGVYGTLDQIPEGQTVEVLSRRQVKCGPVKLLASIDQNGPKLYDGEITRIGAENQRTKNLVIRVTDHRLLKTTGGIVQGMSGCPVLQNGKLAAAITHVFTDDPTMGYGIFAETMCEESARFAVSN